MAIFLDDGLGGGSNSIKAKINSLTVDGLLLKREVPLGVCSSYFLAQHGF